MYQDYNTIRSPPVLDDGDLGKIANILSLVSTMSVEKYSAALSKKSLETHIKKLVHVLRKGIGQRKCQWK